MLSPTLEFKGLMPKMLKLLGAYAGNISRTPPALTRRAIARDVAKKQPSYCPGSFCNQVFDTSKVEQTKHRLFFFSRADDA